MMQGWISRAEFIVDFQSVSNPVLRILDENAKLFVRSDMIILGLDIKQKPVIIIRLQICTIAVAGSRVVNS